MDLKAFFDFFKSNVSPKCSVVIVAAGNSERMGQDKLMLDLHGKPVIYRTINAFEMSEYVDEIVVVTRQDRLESMAKFLSDSNFSKISKVVVGGKTRAESCLAGACAVKRDAKYIAIHDGARPFVTDKLIKNCLFNAVEYKACVPGIRINDTVKKTDNGIIRENVNRDELVRVQTPQIFNADLIKGALTYVISKNIEVTDDSSAVECMGIKVKVIEGDPDNIKLTNPRDLEEAEVILNTRGET